MDSFELRRKTTLRSTRTSDLAAMPQSFRVKVLPFSSSHDFLSDKQSNDISGYFDDFKVH